MCSYGNKIELMGLAATKNYKGTILELRWRSKQPIKLDYTVGLHCLDSEKKTAGGADYQPDILQREMAQGAEWTDTVAISNRELKGATQLGVSIYRPGKETMLCDAPNSDWNTRFVIPFSNLAPK